MCLFFEPHARFFKFAVLMLHAKALLKVFRSVDGTFCGQKIIDSIHQRYK